MNGSAPGTQPEGVRDEREASAWVRRMFSQIAPRYDLLNHLLSFNLDRLWRARTVARFERILFHSDARVLDLCCGTGDLTLALWGKARAGTDSKETQCAKVWGADFAHPMLVRAREKAARAAAARAEDSARVPQFAEADAMQLPFASGSFDLVTAAFGFRNLANYEAGLREICRVLKPGGEVGILEFSAPRNAVFTALYKLYFTQIVPRVGGTVSGSREAYSYLPASVSKFPSPAELTELMSANGFADVRHEPWMFGAVALHVGRKS